MLLAKLAISSEYLNSLHNSGKYHQIYFFLSPWSSLIATFHSKLDDSMYSNISIKYHYQRPLSNVSKIIKIGLCNNNKQILSSLTLSKSHVRTKMVRDTRIFLQFSYSPLKITLTTDCIIKMFFSFYTCVI